MRSSLLLAALAVALAAPGLAQQSRQPGGTVHALPFASEGHTLELAVGGAKAGPAETVALRVEVAEAPAWIRFTSREAAELEGEEPVARLAFDVEPASPIGEVGVVRLAVLAEDGAVWAEHEVRVEVSAPEEARLEAVRPNPSRGIAVVPFVVPAEAEVRLSVFDVLGREVAVLAEGPVAPGAHEARIRAGALAAGVYVVRLVAEGPGGRGVAVRRMTVVR